MRRKMKREKKKTNATIANRFQRVDVTKTQFGNNQKLLDNSFESNAHNYGKKAADVLGKVKGDRFRHEKIKRKRGYKGGTITTDVKSIPLDDD